MAFTIAFIRYGLPVVGPGEIRRICSDKTTHGETAESAEKTHGQPDSDAEREPQP